MKLFPTFSTNPFLKDKANKILWLLIIVLIIGMTATVYFKFPPRVDSVNLQHNIYFGISKIGAWWQIFYFPLYGLIIAIINFTLAYFFYKKEKASSYVLASLTLLAQLIIIWQLFMVMLLNVS